MGISCAPDMCQEIMQSSFQHMDKADAYIDDIGIFTNNPRNNENTTAWQKHLLAIDKVLKTLDNNGFTVNPLKWEWAVKETDWLGHWLTPVGLKPWRKKIKAILNLEEPKTPTQLKSFLGAVNWYQDLWPRKSHVLAQLTNLTGNVKWEWGPA